jgi:diguanylate cyclase (GGDEF)-like protein
LTISCFVAGIVPVMMFTTTETSGIDVALYIVALLGYFVYYSMVKYEFFYLKPAAFNQAFETASEKMYLFDDKLELISWNKSVTEDKLTTGKVEYHIKADALFNNIEIINAIEESNPYSLNEKDKHYVIETIPVLSKRGNKDGFIVKFNDMTSYIERIEKLDYEASHDELTDIINRRAFLEAASEHIKESGTTKSDFAVMMIDLDDFKQINDNFGHPNGDEVLIGVAKSIQNAINKGDLVARYGGEEFVVMVKNADNTAATEIAEKIRIAVSELEFDFQDQKVKIQVSIGVCLSYHENPLDVYEYIKNADEALYVSKRKGKNKVTVV